MLQAFHQLAENINRIVIRILRDEVDAYSLGADQSHDLLNLLEKRLARVVEQEMRLIEEERELRLVQVSDFGEVVVQGGQHPQHERAEQSGLVLHIRQLEYADDSPAVAILLDEVFYLELRLAEKLFGSLLFELDHLPQQHSDGRLRHPAVRLELLGSFIGQILEHRSQVGEIDQQQSLVVAVLEYEREDARLRRVEPEHLCQQQRSERRHCRTKLRALRTGETQELDGKRRRLPLKAGLRRARSDPVVARSRCTEAREVALDVGHEHRHSRGRQLFRNQLQRSRLACPGRARNQAMPVHHRDRDGHQWLWIALAVMDDCAEGDFISSGGKGCPRCFKYSLIHGASRAMMVSSLRPLRPLRSL